MVSVYLQVLTQLKSLGAEVTEKTVLNIMCAYEASGDSDSIREVFSRFNSTGSGSGSAASTVAVYNKVLSAYASTPDLTNWESIVSHCDQYYGPKHVLADATTYDTMMTACEKYGRADDGLRWFDESVRSSATNTVTKVQRESLHRMIGDEKYNEYTSTLSAEHQAKVIRVASSNLKTSSSAGAEAAAAGAGAVVPAPVPARALKSQGTVKVTSLSDTKDSLPKSKKTLTVAGSVVASKKVISKSESLSESESKVSKVKVKVEVDVPSSSSSSNVKSDLESAVKKVWVPSSLSGSRASSKVASDSAASNVEASSSSSSSSKSRLDILAMKVPVPIKSSSVDTAKSLTSADRDTFQEVTYSASTSKAIVSPNRIKQRLLWAANNRRSEFYEVVEQITAELMAANVKPTVDIMNSMISVHSWIGDVVATQRMIDEMKVAGLEPDTVSISFLVSAYLRNSDKAGAERAWTEALTGGLKPGMTCFVLV